MNQRTWKLFIPILFMILVMFFAIYAIVLLNYGSRDKYPIEAIAMILLIVIAIIGLVEIFFIIDIYLSNYLQELKIKNLTEELKTHKKGVD